MTCGSRARSSAPCRSPWPCRSCRCSATARPGASRRCCGGPGRSGPCWPWPPIWPTPCPTWSGTGPPGSGDWPPASGSAGRPRSPPPATPPPWPWPCTRGWPPGPARWWWPGPPWPPASGWPRCRSGPAAPAAAGSPTGCCWSAWPPSPSAGPAPSAPDPEPPAGSRASGCLTGVPGPRNRGGCGCRLPPGRLGVLRFSRRSGNHEPHRCRAPRRSCMVLPALDGKTRCRWAATDPVLATYHDNEWGEAPVGDAGWFERLSLEVFQAGLSWRTVLAKRDGFRRAFHDFEPKIVAAFTAKDVTLVLRDPGIVRNRAKVLATIENAKVVLALAHEHGSFGEWVATQPDELEQQQRVYRQTFQFAGPQVVEAFLQSVGRVAPPHEPGCWRLG